MEMALSLHHTSMQLIYSRVVLFFLDELALVAILIQTDSKSVEEHKIITSLNLRLQSSLSVSVNLSGH